MKDKKGMCPIGFFWRREGFFSKLLGITLVSVFVAAIARFIYLSFYAGFIVLKWVFFAGLFLWLFFKIKDLFRWLKKKIRG